MSEIYLSDEAKKIIDDKTELRRMLLKGSSPCDVLGFSEDAMSQLYGAAYRFFEKKSYQDAADSFLFLSHLDPRHHEYWLGLGMATQMIHDYEGAIDAYEMAAICDITSPVPYFYLAKCLFAIHDHQSSLEALDLAIESAQEREEYADLLEQAIKAREVLLRNKDDEA